MAFGSATSAVTVVDSSTSVNVHCDGVTLTLPVTSDLYSWNQVDVVFEPSESSLQAFLTKPDGSLHVAKATVTTHPFLSSGQLVIGQSVADFPVTFPVEKYFKGIVDEVRVFTRPNNPAVILQNWGVAVSANTPDLLYGWAFTEGVGLKSSDLKVKRQQHFSMRQ